MIREFLSKIFSIRKTNQGIILTIFGEEYISLRSVEALSDRNKVLELAMEKRIKTIQILDSRLKQNMELLERMSCTLDAQNQQMHKQQDIINNQRQKLKFVEQLNWRMNKLKHEQKKIKKAL